MLQYVCVCVSIYSNNMSSTHMSIMQYTMHLYQIKGLKAQLVLISLIPSFSMLHAAKLGVAWERG